MSNSIICSLDGDGAGRLVGRAILSDDVEGLHEISERITSAQDLIQDWAEQHGGHKISGGGDEGTFEIPPEAISDIETLRKDYEFLTNLTVSVGYGSSLSEAGKALLAAKFRGKNMTVKYDQSVEDEIATAKQHCEDGIATEEERKLISAYITPEDGSPKSEDTKNQEYTKEGLRPPSFSSPDQQVNTKIHPQGPPDDQSDTINNTTINVTPEEEEAEKVDGFRQPKKMPIAGSDEAPKNASDMSDHFDSSLDNEEQMHAKMDHQAMMDVTNDNTQSMLDTLDPELSDSDKYDQEPTDVTGHSDNEAPGDMGLHSDGEIDDTVPAGDVDWLNPPKNMDISGDSDYLDQEVQPEDSEESPDLGSVLKDALNDHADAISKEKAIELITDALESFKASKDILERAKEKAPELYAACISMLQAMIEMSKMLDLAGEMSPEEEPESAPKSGPAPIGPQAFTPDKSAGPQETAQ